jgi:SAM-dependent methyltransferase
LSPQSVQSPTEHFHSQGDGDLWQGQLRLLRGTDLDGKSFLDIGGYDGRIAALALDWGAAGAAVVDSGEWRQYAWPEPGRDPRVSLYVADLMTWTSPADVVACFNVLYHLENPIGGLRQLRAITRERLLLCTSFVPGPEHYWRLFDLDDPTERVPEGASAYTVYFKPTVSGLLRALRRVGFEPVEHFTVGDHVLVACR